MSISLDLLVVIIINVMTAGIFIVGLAMSIKFIENQIKRLEEKQDKHNCLIERMVKVEERAKSAHKRIDKIENNDNHNEIHST